LASNGWCPGSCKFTSSPGTFYILKFGSVRTTGIQWMVHNSWIWRCTNKSVPSLTYFQILQASSYGTSIAALNTGAGVLPLHNQSWVLMLFCKTERHILNILIFCPRTYATEHEKSWHACTLQLTKSAMKTSQNLDPKAQLWGFTCLLAFCLRCRRLF
jgi:hypothetical protein